MSEEILAKESEENTEEELSTEEVVAEQDSSDEEAIAEAGKTSVKKEEEDEEEDDSDDSEEDDEEPAEEEKKVKKESAIPKTKNGMLKVFYEKLNGLKKDELTKQYEAILAATDLDQVQEKVEDKKETRTKVAIKAEDLNIDVKDDVEALVQGEDGLTEEFKKKASTIFEAAVQAKVLEEVNKQITGVEDKLKGETDAHEENFRQDMTEKVDGYLTYVVEEWMKDNELAIERGIRTELVEDFMSGLKTLFTEHYIDIPEEKVDMVDDLFEKIEDLEKQLDEQIHTGVEMQKELAQFKKDGALREVTTDLADTETEKISKLAEGIEYENSEQYTEKLNVLKESYFPKSEALGVSQGLTEADTSIKSSDEETPKDLDENMQQYTQALKRFH
jgi:oligoribonuclease (3'-5' exoribonuclease)